MARRKRSVGDVRRGGALKLLTSAKKSPSRYNGPVLPHDLTEMTAIQQAAVVDYFVGLPLKELRKRQDITRLQIPSAFAHRNDLALGNLQITENLLAHAIDVKTFGRRK